MQYWKESVFSLDGSLMRICAATVVLVLAVAGVYLLSRKVQIDYGFSGAMIPVFASLVRRPKVSTAPFW